jgi:HK97 family phage major capsid protein
MSSRNEASDRLEKVYNTGQQSFRTSGVAKAAMGEESGSIGGYLLPIEYSNQIMNVIAEESVIWPRAEVIPMASPELDTPMMDVETAPNSGIAPWWNPMQFKWGSSQAPLETEPKFRQLQLKAWDLLGYSVISNQMLADTGPAGEASLIQQYGRAAAWYAEYAFLQGTGIVALMPLGILNAPGLITQTRANKSQISAVDIANMAAQLLPYGWQRAIWMCSPTALAQIAALSTFSINYSGGGAQETGSYVGRLLTRPLFVTDKLPPLNSTGDLILIDPSLYVIGLRQDVIIDVSPHPLFTTQQTVLRVWLRLDGKPRIANKITLPDTSTIVSGYIALLTHS